jgi:hypothetical protein
VFSKEEFEGRISGGPLSTSRSKGSLPFGTGGSTQIGCVSGVVGPVRTGTALTGGVCQRMDW